MKTQEDMVLEYMQSHKQGITSKQCFELFGILQTPKRIFNLRKRGYDIKATPKTGKNRFGKKVSFVVYTLEGVA